MSGGFSELGILRISDRKAWEKRVAAHMKAADGRLAPAAQAMGVSVRQLARWLAELPDVARASGGRPAGATSRQEAPAKKRRAK